MMMLNKQGADHADHADGGVAYSWSSDESTAAETATTAPNTTTTTIPSDDNSNKIKKNTTDTTSFRNNNSTVSENNNGIVPMTRDQVKKMANVDTLLLLIISNKVYDLTQWRNNNRHPGGNLPLELLCGQDATDAFEGFHPEHLWSSPILNKFHYADLDLEEVGEGAADRQPEPKEKDSTNNTNNNTNISVSEDFRILTKQMKDMGLFETNIYFYYKLAVWITCIGVLVLMGVFISNNFYVHALSGIGLGIFWQQLAFIGHDLGHNSVFLEDRGKNVRVGTFVTCFFTGLCPGWWKRSHNVHHIVSNSVDHDPDIQHAPLFAVSSEFLKRPIFSTFYQRTLPYRNAVAYFLIQYQHYLFYIAMAFGRINMYVMGVTYLMGIGMYSHTRNNGEKKEYRNAQLALIGGFFVWLFALTMQLPTIQSRIAFITLSHVMAGILHVQITLSHFAMPAYSGLLYDGDDGVNSNDNKADQDARFIHTQLQTTMDIECPLYMDWFHGGLQFQAVHHLWPRLPRHNLRKAQSFLVAFCYKHNLNYRREPFFAAKRIMLQRLKAVAAVAAKSPSNHNLKQSFSDLLYDALNMQG